MKNGKVLDTAGRAVQSKASTPERLDEEVAMIGGILAEMGRLHPNRQVEIRVEVLVYLLTCHQGYDLVRDALTLSVEEMREKWPLPALQALLGQPRVRNLVDLAGAERNRRLTGGDVRPGVQDMLERFATPSEDES